MPGTVLDLRVRSTMPGGASVSLRPRPLRPQLTHNPYKEPAWQKVSTRSSSWSGPARNPGRRPPPPRSSEPEDAARPARGGDLATRHAAERRQGRELSREDQGFLQVRRRL